MWAILMILSFGRREGWWGLTNLIMLLSRIKGFSSVVCPE